MADEQQPLDEALQAIANIRHDDTNDDTISWQAVNRQLVQVVRSISRAKAEVDRLRAREAAAMEIVRDAVVDWVGFRSINADCPWCDEFHENYAPADPRPSRPHSANCYVTKACALLAQQEA